MDNDKRIIVFEPKDNIKTYEVSWKQILGKCDKVSISTDKLTSILDNEAIKYLKDKYETI